MLLFFISFLMVFTSSHFLSAFFAKGKVSLWFIYLFIIAFSQIVFTFEILSIFNAITAGWVLTVNTLFFFISVLFRFKNGDQFIDFKPLNFIIRIKNSLKFDKFLLALALSFFVFITSAFILALLMPVTSADGQAYHVARSLFWVLNHTLAHFEAADVRNLCLPINSEILYAWVLVFLKSPIFLGLFSFLGYILSIVSLYQIFSLLGFSMRRKLWVIFILSSFPSVMVQVSGTETDIIIAGLVLSSIYLYWFALKNRKNNPVFFAALAYTLAVGVKTPAIIAVPAVIVLFLCLSKKYKNYWYLLYFSLFFIINFVLFSSYNYVQNLLSFGNVIGSESFIVVSKNYYGFSGLVSNFVKYIFMHFDFTGFRWGEYLSSSILASKSQLLNALGVDFVPDGRFSEPNFINQTLLEPRMGAGILWFLLFLPSIIISIFGFVSKFKRKKELAVFGVLYLINLICISYFLAYMNYSVRFLMFFIMISAPVIGISYFRRANLLKWLFTFFAFYYLTLVSTHFWARPFAKIIPLLKRESVSSIRYRANCTNFDQRPIYTNPSCILVDIIKKESAKGSKVLVYPSSGDYIFTLKQLETSGYQIDFRNLQDGINHDFSKYNLLIIPQEGQISTYIKHNEFKNDNCKYFQNFALTSKDKISKSELLEASLPSSAVCYFDYEFINNQGYKFLTQAGLIDTHKGDKYAYYVYKK